MVLRATVGVIGIGHLVSHFTGQGLDDLKASRCLRAVACGPVAALSDAGQRLTAGYICRGDGV